MRAAARAARRWPWRASTRRARHPPAKRRSSGSTPPRSSCSTPSPASACAAAGTAPATDLDPPSGEGLASGRREFLPSAAVRMDVRAGDHLALNLRSDDAWLGYRETAGATDAVWIPVLSVAELR